jgi:hypothetical protein
MKGIVPYCLLLLIYFTLVDSAGAASTTSATNTISTYLVDISASPVSAGDQVGISGSAITNIQSAHDLTLAISPLATGSGKGGFGLAITPARTSITALATSYDSYINGNIFNRLYGALTLSYAENTSDISGMSYKKSAFSISTAYYPNKDDDAIIQAYKAFDDCKPSELADRLSANAIQQAYAAINLNPKLDEKGKDEEKKVAREQLDSKAAEDAWKACLKKATSKTKWNTSKLTFSAGSGWINPSATAGASQSLGSTFVMGGIYNTDNICSDSGISYTLRRTNREVDLKTLATTPTFSNSTLAAIRYTQGVGNDSTLRVLAELSNAKGNSTATATVSNSVFKYAVGFDKKLSDGVWAEFRFGRKRTEDGTTMQNSALLNLNWSPSSTLLSK